MGKGKPVQRKSRPVDKRRTHLVGNDNGMGQDPTCITTSGQKLGGGFVSYAFVIIVSFAVGFMLHPAISKIYHSTNVASQKENIQERSAQELNFNNSNTRSALKTADIEEVVHEKGVPEMQTGTDGKYRDHASSEPEGVPLTLAPETKAADEGNTADRPRSEATPLTLTPEKQVVEMPAVKSKERQIPGSAKSKQNKSNKKPMKLKKEQPEAALPSNKNEWEQAVKNFKTTILNKLTPKKIFADGRRIPPIHLHHIKPNNSTVKAYLFNDFLSTMECDGLMKVHRQHIEETSKKDPVLCFDSIKTLRRHLKDVKKGHLKVTPKDFTTGTTCVNGTFSRKLQQWLKSNWSYSTAFYPGESRFSHIFAKRVEEATGLSDKNGGKFQITSYPVGIGYKTHTDCIVNYDDKRDRFATILVYLQDVEQGGETQFPELGIWVKPRKGRALVWTNMNSEGECDPLSVHQAAKVDKGHKYILQRWYYYKSFYSLGKRPPEPHIPQREEGTPRVSCDEYEQGSCRWYDEWNYDHILEYERQKMTLV